jgi:hypothetical protein
MNNQDKLIITGNSEYIWDKLELKFIDGNMKTRIHSTIIIVLYIFCTHMVAAQNREYKFPDDWLGTWEGTLDIYKDNKIVQSVPIELNHQPSDDAEMYVWTIRYGTGEASELRDYRLKVLNREKGHYLHDEQNSILLQARVAGLKLISIFEVMGTVLTSAYERQGEMMIFEIIIHNPQNITISGNQMYKDEQIPEVKSFLLSGYQRAELRRK